MIIGDIGTLIELDANEDLSSGTAAKIYYRKPSATTGEWTGVIDDTKITYTTIAGDIDEVGTWSLQGYVNLGVWQGKTDIVTMTVSSAITT